jgi:hypothetical protein
MSHMCRLAEFLPANTVVLAVPGFKSIREPLPNIPKKFNEISLCKNDLVVMDLLSNITYMATGEDRLPTPTFRGGDGRYHVPGSLKTTPPTSVRKTLELFWSWWQQWQIRTFPGWPNATLRN